MIIPECSHNCKFILFNNVSETDRNAILPRQNVSLLCGVWNRDLTELRQLFLWNLSLKQVLQVLILLLLGGQLFHVYETPFIGLNFE